MTAQLIQLTESLRWALETIDHLQRGGKLPPNTISQVAAWGHLYQAERDLMQFCWEMDEQAAEDPFADVYHPDD